MKMTRTRKIMLGLSLAATALGGAAYAQQKGDGSFTRAEAQAKAQEMFARLDVNKDGKLDQADRVARRNAMFDRMDTDHNGQISRAEFDAMGPGARGPRGPEAGGPDGEHGPGKHGWGHRGGHRGGGMMMGRMADANKDGVITQAEFTAAALQRFDRMDTNHDGVVTKEERQAARQAMREQWKSRMGQPEAKPN